MVDAHLAAALDQLRTTHPSLAAAIAAGAPLLDWITYDAYPRAEIGEAFASGHAFASLAGGGAPLAAQDYDLGLFLIAPHVLYRDHCHKAPELYAPLTGPHGWRFGPGLPLSLRPAHDPVWNDPFQPHLTKVGPVPFLCIFGWTRDVNDRHACCPRRTGRRLRRCALRAERSAVQVARDRRSQAEAVEVASNRRAWASSTSGRQQRQVGREIGQPHRNPAAARIAILDADRVAMPGDPHGKRSGAVPMASCDQSDLPLVTTTEKCA